MNKKVFCVCLSVFAGGYIFLSCFTLKISFAAPETASTIGRSQEILREDKALRQKIEQGEQFFVEKIVLKGASKLSQEEIRDIIVPFQDSWMTKKDIQQIIDALKSAYEKKGIETNRFQMACELKETGILEVTVDELSQ